VQVAAETGSLGLLAIVAALVVLGISVWRRLRRNEDEADRLELLLFAGGLIVFLVHALVSFPAHLPTSMMTIALLLGLIHAPTYGDACVVTVRSKRRSVAIGLGVAAIVSVVVSGFVVSDLAANALMYSGHQRLQLGETTEAKRLFERSIASDFAPRQTYYFLATTQLQLGETEAAFENFEKCFTRFVDENTYLVYADVALSLGKISEARQAIEFLLSTKPKREMELRARYIQATLAVRLRDYVGAERILLDLLDDASNYELALIALGNLYQAEGRTEESRDAYDRALGIIERKLSRTEAKMSGRTEFTVGEYSELSHSITTLRTERSFVLEQLADLPED